MSAIPGLDYLREQWESALIQYAQAVGDLDRVEQQLYDVQLDASQDAADWAEWQAQFSKINAIKSTVERLNTIAANVSQFWADAKATFGLSGRRGIAGQLGFAPFAGAVIAGMSVSGFLILIGSVAAVAAGAGAYVMYMSAKADARRYIPDRTKQLTDAGVPPERAAAIALDEATKAAKLSTGYVFTTELTKIALYAVLGIAVVFVVPKLLEGRR